MRLDHQANEKQADESMQHVTLVKQTVLLGAKLTLFHIIFLLGYVRIKIGGNVSLDFWATHEHSRALS